MKKKSLLVVATALVMAFAMVACGTTAPTNDPVESSVEESSVEESSVEESSVEESSEEPVVDEPVADEPVADEPAETPDELVINFVDLSTGGYGYEATVNGEVVDVVIASQYQELQYVLPNVVDLAAYSTLIVDVTSNAQLDIKLVDPNAEVNEYNQLAPFHDGYTAAGEAITSPVHIDLAAFADKDLYQINFMATGNDTTFTLKSITFVK